MNRVASSLNTLLDKVKILAIEKLDGGAYNVDSVLSAIKKFTTWALRVGIALSGAALIIGFILYAIADVDQKSRVKTRIIQTMFGIIGIILSLSIVNLIIDLF